MQISEALLDNLEMVLVKPRFPENIGMIARACANMGAGGITLVDPEMWHPEKARPLATAKGQYILDAVRLELELKDAVAPYALVVGTTARTGGWRRELLHPTQAAKEILAVLAEGERVALMMGPEDRGLNNEEIECCQRLVTIPTAHAASLNVAQASLLLLYECFKAVHDLKEEQKVLMESTECTIHEENVASHNTKVDRRVSAADEARLLENLKETLVQIDFLQKDNPDYFFMPLRRLFGRAGLRRHEYDALMGMCRQIKNKCT